ncbi:unnamed protein product, partial [Adineta ricciae]
EFRGCLSELRSNLSLLRQFKWIDQYTRAILIQMSLYNPNIQMFTSVSFLLELLPAGGVSPSTRFEPFYVQGLTSIVYLIIIVIHVLFLIYYIIKEFQDIHHLKIGYICRIWSFIRLGIIICSWIGMAIYLWRYVEIKRVTNLFHDTNGYLYINLQLIAYINDIFNIIIGFCCFFDHFRRVQKKAKSSQNEDQEAFNYMVKKVICWLGFIKPNQFDCQDEKDEAVRLEYYDTFQYFPIVTDRLMEILYRMR